MNRELKALKAKPSPSALDVDHFVAGNAFPLVDPHGVTFVYRGEADDVFLHCFMSGLDGPQPLRRIAQTDLWAATLELPAASRVEYKLEVVRGEERQLIVDPLNDVLAHDPFGANSVCQGFGYERPAWTLHDPDARHGSLHKHRLRSHAFGGRREIQVYLPATFRRNRVYPLLVCHDGVDYLRYAALKDVLDNLITALDIPPMIVALTDSPNRLVEYAGNVDQANFLAQDVLPFMQKRYPLIDDAAARGIMGASFGGVASLHAAWRFPALYGRLLLQSGSFAFSDFGRHTRGEVFDPVVDFVNAFRERPGHCAQRIYLSCGVYESLIYENRSLVPRLQEQGIDVRFEEVRDAHNWENWRDRLRNALTWLFPGPNWFVYE